MFSAALVSRSTRRLQKTKADHKGRLGDFSDKPTQQYGVGDKDRRF